MAGKLRNAAGAAFIGVLSCTASVALADVTMQQRISVQGVGAMSFGNMSGTTTTAISGNRSRTDTEIQMQSKLVRMFAGRALGPSAEIVLLDDDKIQHLSINKKQYSETTFEAERARLEKALNQKDDKSEDSPEDRKPMDDSKCEWLPPKADVKRGEKATIAGYDAERLTIIASQPCKDKETGSICEVALALDEYLAPKLVAREEELKFQRAYAQKMGLDLSSGKNPFSNRADISQRAQLMFGRYEGIWKEIGGKIKDVKGYPVKMNFAFAIGGAQCKDSQSQQSTQSDSNSDAGPSSPGGLAGAMAGKLGGLFHKKKDDQPPADSAAANPAQPAIVLPDGLIPLITMSSELISVSTDAIGAATFTVPPDFKKVQKD
jgi:hypothetical protein